MASFRLTKLTKITRKSSNSSIAKQNHLHPASIAFAGFWEEESPTGNFCERVNEENTDRRTSEQRQREENQAPGPNQRLSPQQAGF